MSQNIKFQKVRINLMIIEMGRDGSCLHIIGRMLHRREGVNLLAYRQNNDSTRMLSGRTSDTDTAAGDTLDLRCSL